MGNYTRFGSPLLPAPCAQERKEFFFVAQCPVRSVRALASDPRAAKHTCRMRMMTRFRFWPICRHDSFFRACRVLFAFFVVTGNAAGGWGWWADADAAADASES